MEATLRLQGALYHINRTCLRAHVAEEPFDFNIGFLEEFLANATWVESIATIRTEHRNGNHYRYTFTKVEKN